MLLENQNSQAFYFNIASYSFLLFLLTLISSSGASAEKLDVVNGYATNTNQYVFQLENREGKTPWAIAIATSCSPLLPAPQLKEFVQTTFHYHAHLFDTKNPPDGRAVYFYLLPTLESLRPECTERQIPAASLHLWYLLFEGLTEQIRVRKRSPQSTLNKRAFCSESGWEPDYNDQEILQAIKLMAASARWKACEKIGADIYAFTDQFNTKQLEPDHFVPSFLQLFTILHPESEKKQTVSSFPPFPDKVQCWKSALLSTVLRFYTEWEIITKGQNISVETGDQLAAVSSCLYMPVLYVSPETPLDDLKAIYKKFGINVVYFFPTLSCEQLDHFIAIANKPTVIVHLGGLHHSNHKSNCYMISVTLTENLEHASCHTLKAVFLNCGMDGITRFYDPVRRLYPAMP